MADPTVGLDVPALVEIATARIFMTGEFIDDGRVYRLHAVFQAYMDADGNWVKGWYNPQYPEASFCLDGQGVQEVERLREMYHRVAEVSARRK